jgi:hypothetical protein
MLYWFRDREDPGHVGSGVVATNRRDQLRLDRVTVIMGFVEPRRGKIRRIWNFFSPDG